ncbi:MAG TPA: hypothetical protein VNG95_02740 [Gemmatimonadales bacterium]|nr:hypothetical protein [Gemmatimonadales bacterium]
MGTGVTPFWDAWPSWLVELFGGLAAAALAQLPYLAGIAWYSNLLALLVATALSLAYERWLDRNGFSWGDVGQRSPWIAAGLLLAAWIRP